MATARKQLETSSRTWDNKTRMRYRLGDLIHGKYRLRYDSTAWAGEERTVGKYHTDAKTEITRKVLPGHTN